MPQRQKLEKPPKHPFLPHILPPHLPPPTNKPPLTVKPKHQTRPSKRQNLRIVVIFKLKTSGGFRCQIVVLSVTPWQLPPRIGDWKGSRLESPVPGIPFSKLISINQ